MDVKTLSIDLIGLSVRSTNALHRAEIHIVGDMLEQSEESLKKVRNLGKKSIDEILEKIQEYKAIDETGGTNDTPVSEVSFTIPEDFEDWLNEQKEIFDEIKERIS